MKGNTYCETCNDTGSTEETCNNCSGSGEGIIDGTLYTTCGGKGTLYFECPDCELNLPEEERA